ncbi:ATP-binding protein [Singulisphaera acidiphila]|uniref:histidine kinase n=1 Tax=Singulisphaera acidiphila (strain ATCC BAA-1392 / DSM 18658 / VKM B-2454 / MOB10) TaxID=886293 RepID=L0D9S6_SINAD|nr:ATP-binding protein [Singulisphaera acidiphila]AGA26149.1 signal transduction histidine kinase [Singulisphaera acidiphila DSM 18658]
MSYRSFKHLLGETSLERKCRFIFGGGILVLVTVSFYSYGQKTESLVVNQTTNTARMLVKPTLMNLHYKATGNSEFAQVINMLWDDLSPLDDLPKYESKIYKPFTTDKKDIPESEFAQNALTLFKRASSSEEAFRKAGNPRKPYTFGDGSPMSYWRIAPGKKIYEYNQAVLYTPGCLIGCHGSRENAVDNDHMWREGFDGKLVPRKAGELAGMVSIQLRMEPTNRAIHNNRAILITAALVTAILAMVASYVIVRYVIVKPVKHLRDVSDAIAAGKLNIRSQIQTGDEFEELSHAFNRMLHNLVSMQQELRDVNGDLDRKVDELAQANMALFEMNRLKSDFLATMSHELRTPLNSIIGFSEVLAGSEQINERQRRYASNIQSSGKMLLGMINDILDLAKIESGKMEVRTEDFSIRDVCEALTSLARPIAERKNIDLECRLDEAIPLLRQDSGKLRQILYNLLSNAIKFTPEGGRVSLRARTEGRHVVIDVADTGIGIAEEDRERIFEKFRQAGGPGQEDSVLTREHQGTGLGLSIVRELTKLLGGDIFLESRPGQGSTFTVRLPMQLPGNRKFEVNLSDERIDLSKARRVEARPQLPHGPASSSDAGLPHGSPHVPFGETIRGSGRNY